MYALLQQPDGSKGVKVGSRIAVLAEPDDDLSTLSIPEETSKSPSPPQEETKSGIEKSKSLESQAEAPPTSKGDDTAPSSAKSEKPPSKPSSENPSKQKYPLYPSVAQLLHEKGIDASEVDKIPASGPQGRLLKGDVLAYLGSITASYSSEQSARIEKLGHLDLSNIKIRPPPRVPESATVSEAASKAIEVDNDTEVAVPISFKVVKEVQERIHNVLGIDIPLQTFIDRAIEVSNMDLPRSKSTKPTSDELFNEILGLDTLSSSISHGNYTPQIVALPSTNTPAPRVTGQKPDIIDMLTSKNSPPFLSHNKVPAPTSVGSTGGSAVNVFSVSVPKGEEQRAKKFLERMKTILQVDPGRLVL